ncbi:putative zinc-binding protein [Sinanaerobacter chloroacetimidivorans]|uniref:Glycine cleavage system protein H n=1 Tax=Sinanaerobacter chloroacetimidivorans TaxID=2818044 RepID=A0A8J7W192_9FIRM|nr:putative zinc-binding protein [Sinanaerobacter chloroacetimidivorans]MBR0598549.1 glycine cleavage system protein H [Sinanaerobacter chloroacetimidivorans]
MSKSYAILPCNGLDKCAGCVSKEVAITLLENTESEIICPVFYRVADAKYNKLAQEKPLLVIDGCSTRCASKLAAEKNLKIAEKINVTEEAKDNGITLSNNLHIGENELKLIKVISEKLTTEQDAIASSEDSISFPANLTYDSYKKDKFVFRVPKEPGFFFNENDVWAYVVGNRARIGVTDYVQKSLSDIMFFTPASIGNEIEQFEEAGSIESGKAVFEIVSPVGGKITAINEKLIEAPELINQNPYEEGWIAELELSDFESDKDLLHDFDGYYPVLKRKVDEFHV